jgi:peptidyl-prolyl cis-trans isomerase B (cyclophilin B)
MLSMATLLPNENSTQFYITFVRASWLDGRFVVFEELLEGFDTLEVVEFMGDQDSRPRMPIVITCCGQQ